MFKVTSIIDTFRIERRMLRVRFRKNRASAETRKKRPQAVAALDLDHDCGHDTFLFPRHNRREPGRHCGSPVGTAGLVLQPDLVIFMADGLDAGSGRFLARCWRRRRHVDHRSRWRKSRGWLDDQGAERCCDLVAGEWDLTVWWRTLFASAGPGDGSCWDVAGWPRSC